MSYDTSTSAFIAGSPRTNNIHYVKKILVPGRSFVLGSFFNRLFHLLNILQLIFLSKRLENFQIHCFYNSFLCRASRHIVVQPGSGIYFNPGWIAFVTSTEPPPVDKFALSSRKIFSPFGRMLVREYPCLCNFIFILASSKLICVSLPDAKKDFCFCLRSARTELFPSPITDSGIRSYAEIMSLPKTTMR